MYIGGDFIGLAHSVQSFPPHSLMDWIEHLFHISPDEGNGSLELLLILCPIAGLLTGIVGLLWLRQKRNNAASTTGSTDHDDRVV